MDRDDGFLRGREQGMQGRCLADRTAGCSFSRSTTTWAWLVGSSGWTLRAPSVGRSVTCVSTGTCISVDGTAGSARGTPDPPLGWPAAFVKKFFSLFGVSARGVRLRCLGRASGRYCLFIVVQRLSMWFDRWWHEVNRGCSLRFRLIHRSMDSLRRP